MLEKRINTPLIEVDLCFEGRIIFECDCEIIGDLKCQEMSTEHSLIVRGDEYIIGDQHVGGNQDVIGNQTVGGNQDVRGNQIVGGNQDVGGKQYVEGNQYVGGKQKVGGDQSVIGYQYVEGDQYVGGTKGVAGKYTVRGKQKVGVDQNFLETKNEDIINSPTHYTSGGIETIEFIRAKLSKDSFHGYLKGNVIKYLSRAGKKGDELQDLKKAQWYLTNLIEDLQGE